MLSADPGVICCRIGQVDLRVNATGPQQGDTVSVMVRPERVVVSENAAPDDATNVLRGRVATLTFRGARTAVHLDIRGLRIEAEVANIAGEQPAWLEQGADVSVHVSPRALRVLGVDGAPAREPVSVPAPDEQPS